MSERTYASIQPLIVAEKQDANVMRVTFRCPRSGRVLSADAIIEEEETAGTVARDVAKREVSWGVFRWVADAVSSVVGGGMAGHIAGDVAGEVAYEGVSNSGNFVFSAKQKQAAVLEAFRSVEDQWVFDEQASQWVLR